MASSYNSSQAFKVARHFQFKNGVNIETITADKNLTYKDSMFQVITNSKGSSATIKTPPKKDGAIFFFRNDASSGHAYVIQDADGNPIIGGGGVAAGESAIVVCDGSSWDILLHA
jgi:hypothetical protein